MSPDTGKSMIDTYITQGKEIRDSEKNKSSYFKMTPNQLKEYEQRELKKAEKGPNFVK